MLSHSKCPLPRPLATLENLLRGSAPQNIENNPMQSNEATADAWTSNLTRRANQRYLLLFRNHANAPMSPQQRTRPSRLRSENSYPPCHCKGDLAGKHSIRINDQWRVVVPVDRRGSGGRGDNGPSRARACIHRSRRLGSRALGVCYGPTRSRKRTLP